MQVRQVCPEQMEQRREVFPSRCWSKNQGHDQFQVKVRQRQSSKIILGFSRECVEISCMLQRLSISAQMIFFY